MEDFLRLLVIGIAIELITLAYTIYMDNQEPEKVTDINQLPSETDDSINGVRVDSVRIPSGFNFNIIINRNGNNHNKPI